jgi:hypothetical protein
LTLFLKALLKQQEGAVSIGFGAYFLIKAWVMGNRRPETSVAPPG